MEADKKRCSDLRNKLSWFRQTIGIKTDYFKVPFLIHLLEKSSLIKHCSGTTKRRCYMLASWLILYYFNISWAISIRSFGVIKGTLNPPCCRQINTTIVYDIPQNCTCWDPFIGDYGTSLIGALDGAFLIPFTLSTLILGNIADHLNYRYVLTIGGSNVVILMLLFGSAYFLSIHSFPYFLVIQILYGVSAAVYSSCFAVIGIWFHGCKRKNTIISLWATYSGVGRILGGLLPAIFADGPWGYSYILISSLILIAVILVFLFLVPYPDYVGINLSKNKNAKSVNNEIKSGKNGIKIWRALLIPGVIEFAITFFFNKSVYYTFLFWLPYLIRNTVIGGISYQSSLSAVFSILFDIGSIFGVVTGGFIADKLHSYSLICTIYLYIGAVLIYVYSIVNSIHLAANLICLFFIGFTVNGTHALILSCVSIDLGRNKKIMEQNKRAIATMNGIINFSGSVGASITVSLIGVVFQLGVNAVLYVMIAGMILSALFITRIAVKDIIRIYTNYRSYVYVVQD
ncbi:Sugar phosphate exchanger 2 [Oopsacas minuta]|uniref:Sugar phosphate exchanger 2 n=1 Tax=Oopsacas minuta TaxID=111878 RepID=A0AAV7KLF5_9METZ|nr:Sugar phosphate exchanger 2 [Oopsacas minuta]